MRKIEIYYQTITPESAKHGDFADQGPYDVLKKHDVANALEHIEMNYGLLEPSSSVFHNDIWYTTIDPEQDLYSGEDTFYTFHLDGYNLEDQKQFYKLVKTK